MPFRVFPVSAKDLKESEKR